ncbi:MAG TPA: protein kinase [Gemmatimonadaceae bacterium]|nr:protein kinase [Gemmatimonadaceae bacterium]
MTDPMRDRVVAVVGDAYELGPELGRGGMAIVYRATDLRLRRDVAIKVLPPEMAFRADVRRRFLREAETAAQLDHSNIVPIYSVDERGGLVYFVMALVDGENLSARLSRGRPTIEETRGILRDVADALAYACSRGVIHRDIKPDNIIIRREDGRALVTDFGIARAAEADSHLTATGVAVGTPAYMSPEQALGEREVDGRSDIYSLGIVAFQMLTGALPFTAANTPAMMMKHVSEMPPPLLQLRPDLPPGLAAAVERAIAKRPEDRWQDAAAFRDALSNEGAAPWLHETRTMRSPSSPRNDDREARPLSSAPPSVPPPPAFPPTRYSRPSSAPSPPTAPPPAPQPLPYLGSLRGGGRRSRRERKHDSMETFAARPLEQRIVIFRRNLAGTGATVATLAGINFLTSPHFPWFLFAAMGMGANIARQWSSLWAEGVTWKRIFQRDIPPPASVPAQQLPEGKRSARATARSAGAAEEGAAKLASPEVLAGPHGAAVRRVASDREAIFSILRTLSKADRELIPDVVPTVDALAARASSIAFMLHHLDTDVSPDALKRLESRIAQVRAEPEDSADHSRRLSLLERQHASLAELTTRRARLYGQLESVVMAMQNLKLDLLKLSSSGVQAALAEVTSATVEARALSRDIDHVLAAADEVRRM